MTGVDVKGVIAVVILAPLPQFVRHDQVCTVLELRLLDQAGFLAVGVVGAGAIVAAHAVVIAAAIRHSGQHRLPLDHIPGISGINVDCFVARSVHVDVFNAGNAGFGLDVMQGGIVTVGRALRVGANGNVGINKQVCGLLGRHREVVHALCVNGGSVLVVVGSAALNGAAVALACILQLDHALLPFQQVAGCTSVLAATGTPQLHQLGVALVVHRCQTRVTADLAVILHTGEILRVCNVRIGLAGTVGALRPLLVTAGRVATHTQDAVAALVALTHIGILLQHPDQMIGTAHKIVVVDVLASVDRVAAVLVLFCRHFHAPELRQTGKIILAGFCGGRRSAGQAHAVVGQLTDCSIGCAEQRELYAMHTAVVQHTAEPTFQHPVIGAGIRIPVRRPPVYEQHVHFPCRGHFLSQRVIVPVDGVFIAGCQNGGTAIARRRHGGTGHRSKNLLQGFIGCHVSSCHV